MCHSGPMLRYRLIHPELLAGLAEAGHGSRVLVADALYPHDSGAPPGARRVHLNLTPGTVPVTEVLPLLAEACHIEAVDFMADADGAASPTVRRCQDLLAEHRHWGGQQVAWSAVERMAFYDLARDPAVTLVVATGEVQPYSNLLVTIGVP